MIEINFIKKITTNNDPSKLTILKLFKTNSIQQKLIIED